jgi:DnaK suppressor protein
MKAPLARVRVIPANTDGTRKPPRTASKLPGGAGTSKRQLPAGRSKLPAEPARSSSREEPKRTTTARPPSRRIKAAELAKIRQLLSQKKISLTNHLQTELSELEKPEKRHRTDLEEIASDTHDTDSLCEIMDIEATQIGQIDLALSKIDNGTYGICEDCAGEIPLVRLQALPFATQCIDCRRKAEIQGQISASDSRMA